MASTWYTVDEHQYQPLLLKKCPNPARCTTPKHWSEGQSYRSQREAEHAARTSYDVPAVRIVKHTVSRQILKTIKLE